MASALQSPDPELPDPAGGRLEQTGHRGSQEQNALLSFPHLSRMVKDDRGTFMFVGDASNLCFLQNIRRIVLKHFGPCPLVDDPLRHCMVEAHPKRTLSLAQESTMFPPKRPSLGDMEYYLVWFQRATDCTVQLFDPDQIRKDMSQWLRDPEGPSGAEVAIFHLIIAIGAQVGPEDCDKLAEHHFNFGRYLILSALMDDPSIATIQCHVLITTYLLASSRRNAAFMYLGIAVRGMYALGLHRRDVSALYDHADFLVRERLWKAIRIMDLFMSASLGRPPATTETRDTTAAENYSASNDLCWIFENILTGIYAKRAVTTENLERISELHRKWSSRFTADLQSDETRPNGSFSQGDDLNANIGLIHLKEAYYWTIILVSRPFLVEYASSILDQKHMEGSASSNSNPWQPSSSHFVVVQACVDCALRTAELLQPLVSETLVPKRLPFVVNSAFVSALVLGLALFADLDDAESISGGFQDCRRVLVKFSKHDAVTRRYLAITENLQRACEASSQERQKKKNDIKSRSIRRLFGSIHDGAPTSPQSASGKPSTAMEETAMEDADSRPQLVSPPVTESASMGATHESLAPQTTDAGHDAQVSTLQGQLSPFAATGDTQGFGGQAMNLLSPSTLLFGAFDESMLLPVVDSSAVDFEIPADWDKGFLP